MFGDNPPTPPDTQSDSQSLINIADPTPIDAHLADSQLGAETQPGTGAWVDDPSNPAFPQGDVFTPPRVSGHRVDDPDNPAYPQDRFDQSGAGGPADPTPARPAAGAPGDQGTGDDTSGVTGFVAVAGDVATDPAGVVAVDDPAGTSVSGSVAPGAGGEAAPSQGGVGAGDDPAETSVTGSVAPGPGGEAAPGGVGDDPAGTSVSGSVVPGAGGDARARPGRCRCG